MEKLTACADGCYSLQVNLTKHLKVKDLKLTHICLRFFPNSYININFYQMAQQLSGITQQTSYSKQANWWYEVWTPNRNRHLACVISLASSHTGTRIITAAWWTTITATWWHCTWIHCCISEKVNKFNNYNHTSNKRRIYLCYAISMRSHIREGPVQGLSYHKEVTFLRKSQGGYYTQPYT